MCFALPPLVGVREEGLQLAPGHPVGEKYEGLRTVACRPLPCAMKNIFFLSVLPSEASSDHAEYRTAETKSSC